MSFSFRNLNPRLIFLFFIVTAFLECTLTGCSSQSKKETSVLVPPKLTQEEQRQESPLDSVEKEAELGRLIAARLLGDYGYYKNHRINKYVGMIGQTLAFQAGRPELKYVFGVLNTTEQLSFGLPGGYILISKGLLKQAQSESEVAFYLAREMSRVNNKFLLNKLNFRGRVWSAEQVASLSDQALRILLGSGYSKEEVLSADNTGAIYTMVTGYDSESFSNILGRASKKKTLIPLAERKVGVPERLAAFKNFLARNDMKFNASDLLELDRRFKKALADLE